MADQNQARVVTRDISRYPSFLKISFRRMEGTKVMIVGGGSSHEIDVWRNGPLLNKRKFQDRVASEVKKANEICRTLNGEVS